MTSLRSLRLSRIVHYPLVILTFPSAILLPFSNGQASGCFLAIGHFASSIPMKCSILVQLLYIGREPPYAVNVRDAQMHRKQQVGANVSRRLSRGTFLSHPISISISSLISAADRFLDRSGHIPIIPKCTPYVLFGDIFFFYLSLNSDSHTPHLVQWIFILSHFLKHKLVKSFWEKYASSKAQTIRNCL